MTDQLVLFSPASPPRLDADAMLRSLPANAPGGCCGHWRLQHRQATRPVGVFGGDPFGACDFCDCRRFEEAVGL